MEFQAKKVECQNRRNIIVDGNIVGEIWEAHQEIPKKFQCQIQVKGHLCLSFNGFGDTEEESIKASIENARKDALDITTMANWLEKELD